MRFQQLPGVVVDVDFLHSHGVILLFSAAAHSSRARAVGVDTFRTCRAHHSTPRGRSPLESRGQARRVTFVPPPRKTTRRSEERRVGKEWRYRGATKL